MHLDEVSRLLQSAVSPDAKFQGSLVCSVQLFTWARRFDLVTWFRSRLHLWGVKIIWGGAIEGSGERNS